MIDAMFHARTLLLLLATHAVSCGPRPTVPSPAPSIQQEHHEAAVQPDGSVQSTPIAPTQRSSDLSPADEQVSEWLDRAAKAMHNGFNPELDVAPELLVSKRAAWERAVEQGDEARQVDAASALSRYPKPAELRSFWRKQLAHEQAAVRFFAICMLANLHSPDDFEAVLAVAVREPASAHPLASRLRDWSDRRAAPALAMFLDNPDRTVAENAALSLQRTPGVPSLEPEVIGKPVAVALPNGAHATSLPSSLVPPYRRWWNSEGQASFRTELAWWNRFVATHR